HHRHRLQRLDLDILVPARIGMLHRQHPHRALAPDDRDAGEAVEPVLARLRLVREIGVAGGFVQVQHLAVRRDRADQPLAQRQLLHYQRADGVSLTATLYLPPEYKASDGPLPTILHAYPAEFKSRDAAGQVKGSPNRYPEYGFYDLPPLLAQAGFAVLFDASLPVLGEGGAEPNDTFVEQIAAGAQAAIDEGVRLGVVDRNRVGVTGHSYGAFMTANLLAHTDLFKAGVALSGAYNRSLTPFGFQREERTYWQDPSLYFEMSPFSYADKIKEPLLLMHGAADDNQGTFPIQSERFYAALKGNGATTKLVFLPYEAHRYDARQSVNEVLWEWTDWFTRYLR
ncbi:hypothetical protein LTR94_024191, partial [Friedmanniomyces endolithicus]